MSNVDMKIVGEWLQSYDKYDWLLDEIKYYSDKRFIKGSRTWEFDTYIYRIDQIKTYVDDGTDLSFDIQHPIKLANYIILKLFIVLCFCKIFEKYCESLEINSIEDLPYTLEYTGIFFNYQGKEIRIIWALDENINKLSSGAIKLISDPLLTIHNDTDHTKYSCNLSKFTKKSLDQFVERE